MIGRWFTAEVFASFTAKPDAYDRLTADEQRAITPDNRGPYFCVCPTHSTSSKPSGQFLGTGTLFG